VDAAWAAARAAAGDAARAAARAAEREWQEGRLRQMLRGEIDPITDHPTFNKEGGYEG